MRKRDILFIVVLLLIGWWAVPHVKEDVARAIVPDSIERLFPRLIDRLTRRHREPAPETQERRMESQAELSRLANIDPVVGTAAASEPSRIDHSYGW